MPALRNADLRKRLKAALPADAVFETGPEDVHPALVTLPKLGRVRIYLWTLTADRSASGARPAGEFKIQLILPTLLRKTKAKGSLELDGAYTALLGFSPDYGVFVGWDARLYTAFAYSANVQAREELLAEARDGGWSVAPPRRNDEVRVAFSPGNLARFIAASRRADQRNLVGRFREAYFLSRTPNAPAGPAKPAATEQELAQQVEWQRQRIAGSRLQRDSKFAPEVKKQYRHACAVCDVQLAIVEAAHIIGVAESDSRDELWNGIAMCPNHHRLFDARSFAVAPDLSIHLDEEAINFFVESRRNDGIELLTDYRGERLRAPAFWTDRGGLRSKMRGALERRFSQAAL